MPALGHLHLKPPICRRLVCTRATSGMPDELDARVLQLGLHQLRRAYASLPGHARRPRCSAGRPAGVQLFAHWGHGSTARRWRPQLAGRPVPPSVQCSRRRLGAQSVPSWQTSRRRCSVMRTPLRDRRESTLSSGGACGQNSPAGRPEAPSAGVPPTPRPVTRQPRSARLCATGRTCTDPAPPPEGGAQPAPPCDAARASARLPARS